MTKRIDQDWRPRLSIEIDEGRYKELQKFLPWGTKNQLFLILIDEVLRNVREHGQIFLGALFSGKVRIVIVLPDKEGGT
jgi:hypothetical protein